MTDFDPARELLAAAYERTDCLTMPWTIRNCERDSLAQPLQVALAALDELLERVGNVDYWDGAGCDLLDWVLRGRIERGDGSVERNRHFKPLSKDQGVQP